MELDLRTIDDPDDAPGKQLNLLKVPKRVVTIKFTALRATLTRNVSIRRNSKEVRDSIGGCRLSKGGAAMMGTWEVWVARSVPCAGAFQSQPYPKP